MADIKLQFAANAPPLSVILTAKLAGIPISEDATLSSGSDPTLLLPSGSKFNGTYAILRYLGRIAGNNHNLYENERDDLESTQIDEWLDCARGFEFERLCTSLDDYLLHHRYLVGFNNNGPFLVGNSLSIADIAIWSNLAVTRMRWVSLWCSSKYTYLGYWYNSISVAHGAVLKEVIIKYIGTHTSVYDLHLELSK